MITFREIIPGDSSLLEDRIRNAGYYASHYSPYNLFCLRNKYGTRICAEGSALFIRQEKRDTERYAAYLYPVGGSGKADRLREVFRHAASLDKRPLFWGLTEPQATELNEVYPGRFDCREIEGWSDYLYRADDLYAAMKDAAIFERRFAGQFVLQRIDSGNIGEVVAFQDWWLSQNVKENGAPESLSLEHRGICEALENWDALPIHGVLIRFGDEIRGYTITLKQTDEYATSHVLKVDKRQRHRGLAQFVMKCGLQCTGMPFVNLEEDIGLAGLRAFKMMLHPFALLTKYRALYISDSLWEADSSE